jgi:hypothetical protein
MSRACEWVVGAAMLVLLLVVVYVVVGCSSFPPVSVSAGFMGAKVKVQTPGWSKAEVPVVQSQALTTPTLLVPMGSPVADELTAKVTSVAGTGEAAGGSSVVPVVVAPVKTETLAVPASIDTVSRKEQ